MKREICEEDARKAEAFNLYTANWILRIDSFNNSIILVSGGVMSITIGAFLGSVPPGIDDFSILLIRSAWRAFAVSLACSILIKFLLVVSGASVLKNWKEAIQIDQDGRTIINSPKYIRGAAWVFGGFSVVSCMLGVLLISFGASSLLKLP